MLKLMWTSLAVFYCSDCAVLVFYHFHDLGFCQPLQNFIAPSCQGWLALMWLLIKVEKLNFRRYQCCCNCFDYQNTVEWSEALKHFSLIFLSPFLSSPMSLSPSLPSPPLFFSFPGLQCLTTWWYERDWLATLDIPWIYLAVFLVYKSYLTCQNALKVFLWFYVLNQQSAELSCKPLGEGRIWFALQWFLVRRSACAEGRVHAMKMFIYLYTKSSYLYGNISKHHSPSISWLNYWQWSSATRADSHILFKCKVFKCLFNDSW